MSINIRNAKNYIDNIEFIKKNKQNKRSMFESAKFTITLVLYNPEQYWIRQLVCTQEDATNSYSLTFTKLKKLALF